MCVYNEPKIILVLVDINQSIDEVMRENDFYIFLLPVTMTFDI